MNGKEACLIVGGTEGGVVKRLCLEALEKILRAIHDPRHRALTGGGVNLGRSRLRGGVRPCFQ